MSGEKQSGVLVVASFVLPVLAPLAALVVPWLRRAGVLSVPSCPPAPVEEKPRQLLEGVEVCPSADPTAPPRGDDDVQRYLIQAAREVRRFTWSPYSHFGVGAALREAGPPYRVFRGTNCENAAFPCGICAERGAIMQGVAVGVYRFDRCAIVTEAEKPTAPCGQCRQMLSEFGLDLFMSSVAKDNVQADYVLRDILPYCFTREDFVVP